MRRLVEEPGNGRSGSPLHLCCKQTLLSPRTIRYSSSASPNAERHRFNFPSLSLLRLVCLIFHILPKGAYITFVAAVLWNEATCTLAWTAGWIEFVKRRYWIVYVALHSEISSLDLTHPLLRSGGRLLCRAQGPDPDPSSVQLLKGTDWMIYIYILF